VRGLYKCGNLVHAGKEFALEEIASGERLEPRLHAMTRMLVRRYRVRIERVAEALLARTTLSSKALDKLVGRSVNDVKVNAPFLLAMHQQAKTG
jgi:hypothetical protein